MSEPSVSEMLSRELHQTHAAGKKLEHFAITFMDALRWLQNLHNCSSTLNRHKRNIPNIIRGRTQFLGFPVE